MISISFFRAHMTYEALCTSRNSMNKSCAHARLEENKLLQASGYKAINSKCGDSYESWQHTKTASRSTEALEHNSIL